jgi:NAD(P)H-flavin reductase
MLLAIIHQLKQDLKNSQKELANAKGVVATVTDQFEELSADYELVCGQLDDVKAATATMEERHEDELRECKLEISCLRNELYLVDERGKVAIQSAAPKMPSSLSFSPNPLKALPKRPP